MDIERRGVNRGRGRPWIVPGVAAFVLGAALLAAMPAAAVGSRPSLAAGEQVLTTEAGRVRVATVAGGLEHPWGMVFLPDGRMLVTERPGRLRIVDRDGRLSAPLAGVPLVFAEGQGGLLDVALDPQFAANRLVYLSYAEPGQGVDGRGGAGTAVARGRLAENGSGLEQVQVIFRQEPKVSGPNHFGSRLVFAPDGTLFVTTGERFKFSPAQDLQSGLGKIMRINPDGTIPADNPFVGRQDAQPAIWSYGHRNVQGAAINPQTKVLWAAEFGPQGGDEVNIPEAGRNYGWPLVSWGRHYSGEPIPDPTTRPDLAQPIHHWTPSVSPSGIAFYTGGMFPRWRGNLLLACLSAEELIRLTLDGDTVAGEERIELGSRLRDVVQGPDGAVYLLTDDGDDRILRLTPAG